MNIVLIAILFGLQAESTSVLEKNETSGTDANKTAIPHGANITATLPLLVVYPEGSQISPLGFSTDAEGKLQVEFFLINP